MLSTLQSSIPYCLRPKNPQLRPHPTIPTVVLCQGTRPRSSAGHHGHQGPRWSAQSAEEYSSRGAVPFRPGCCPTTWLTPASSPPFSHPQPAVISPPLPQPPFYSRGLATGALKPFVFIRRFLQGDQVLTGTLQGRECSHGFCAGGLIKDGVFFSIFLSSCPVSQQVPCMRVSRGWG